MKTKLTSLTLAATCLALLCATSVSLQAATITVTNIADSGPGTLRAALAGATNGDTIDATGVSGTITLTNSQLNVSSSVTIVGPGPATLTVSGNHAARVFNVTGLNVRISGLTIANGHSDNGGGIYNSPGVTMTVSNCTVSGNTAGGSGGGICSTKATLMVLASTLSGNSAGSYGGGIYNDLSATINASTLSGNSASAFGGGIYNFGEQEDSPWLMIYASTLSGNSAENGGGICNDGSATAEIGDTILNAGATGGTLDTTGPLFISDGYNLSSDLGGSFLTATGDQINTDPKLGPLQNNGGPTWTHALLPGSPAIDKGKTNAIPALARSTDQRGLARPVDNPYLANAPGGDGSDIGAFEVQGSGGYDTDADGLPDFWELAWFGNLSQSGADDFDGTGQNNLFKYVAGLDPTDPASVFKLRIEKVAGQPSQKNLSFKPWASGRTYTPQFTTNLATTAFAPLTGCGGPTTNGTEVIVTDLNATGQQKFYRIQIALP
jgi:predicted outer membrane repeat protein